MRLALLFAVTVLGTMVHTAVQSVVEDDNVLTAKRMLEAHQLDGLAVSPVGSHAIVGVKRYTFEKDSTRKALLLIDVPSSKQDVELAGKEKRTTLPALLSTRSSDALWLSDEEVVYVDDKTLYVKHVAAARGQNAAEQAGAHGRHAGILPTAPTSMRIAPSTQDGHATLVFSAEVYADSDLTKVAEHDASDAVKEWDDVKVYDSVFVRHWDKWLYPGKRSQLFSVDLKRHGKGASAAWSLASPFRNLLNGTELESPVAPFGDAGDYSVSATHVAFTARDPDVNGAWHTKHNIYLVPLDGSQPPTSLTKGQHGASSSPTFSPKGAHLAWLQMYIDGYEADRNRITIAHIPTNKQVTILPDWQLSPSSIGFSSDGKGLVGVVEKEARKRLFTVELHRGNGDRLEGEAITTLDTHEVVYQTEQGSVSKVESTASANAWVVSASTLRGPGEVYLVSPHAESSNETTKSRAVPLTDFTHEDGSPLAGLDLGPEAEHITYKGANGRDAYAWILKPPGYDEAAKGRYPLLMLAHGGPESAWTDSWGRRWNMAAFAAQGYVCVAINPAGSTGYGQAFTEEILGQLGGAPFEDVILGTKHVLDTMPSVDRTRVVGAGASYGGFMMAWIQGHNDEGLFKGLVCHDGIFSIQGMAFATEELYFPEYEAGGPLLDPAVRQRFMRWSPEQFVHKWRTPMLVIHGGRDYRLTESEGLSMFNVLQRQGVPSRLLYFPHESHWVTKPKNSLKWHAEVFDWLRRYSSETEQAKDDAQEQVLFRLQQV